MIVCESADLALYILSIGLLFNLLNLILYFRIGFIKWQGKDDPTVKEKVDAIETGELVQPPQRRESDYSNVVQNIKEGKATAQDYNTIVQKEKERKLSIGPYIINQDLESDLFQVKDLSTISAYSTNTLRGNQSLLAMTIATSFLLMFVNIYYSISNPGNRDLYEWFIMVSYSALILVGLFPSGDVIVYKNRYLRKWNVFFCCNIKTYWSKDVHMIGALFFLLGPTSINIHLNKQGQSGGHGSYFAVAVFSLIMSIIFFLCQGLILLLTSFVSNYDNLQLWDEPEGYSHACRSFCLTRCPSCCYKEETDEKKKSINNNNFRLYSKKKENLKPMKKNLKEYTQK